MLAVHVGGFTLFITTVPCCRRWKGQSVNSKLPLPRRTVKVLHGMNYTFSHITAVELERRAEEEHQAALRVAARASVKEPKVLQQHHDAALHILPMAVVHQNMLQLPRRPIIQVPFFGLHKFIPFRSTHPAGRGVSTELPIYSQLT